MLSICVFGGASEGNEAHRNSVTALAQYFIQQSCSFVYGGGSRGLIGLFSSILLKHKKNVTGIIPDFLKKQEEPPENLSHLITCNTLAERKEKMKAQADVFLVLPGGVGTCDEVMNVISDKNLGLLHHPCVFFDVDGYWSPLFLMIEQMKILGYCDDSPLYTICDNVESVGRSFFL